MGPEIHVAKTHLSINCQLAEWAFTSALSATPICVGDLTIAAFFTSSVGSVCSIVYSEKKILHSPYH
jgi:hypothetical protein